MGEKNEDHLNKGPYNGDFLAVRHIGGGVNLETHPYKWVL